MKVALRITVILICLAIMIIALLPPPAEQEAVTVTATPVPVPTAQVGGSQKVIRDLLGGAAIDSGKKAKEIISEENERREKEFEDIGF